MRHDNLQAAVFVTIFSSDMRICQATTARYAVAAISCSVHARFVRRDFSSHGAEMLCAEIFQGHENLFNGMRCFIKHRLFATSAVSSFKVRAQLPRRSKSSFSRADKLCGAVICIGTHSHEPLHDCRFQV